MEYLLLWFYTMPLMSVTGYMVIQFIVFQVLRHKNEGDNRFRWRARMRTMLKCCWRILPKPAQSCKRFSFYIEKRNETCV